VKHPKDICTQAIQELNANRKSFVDGFQKQCRRINWSDWWRMNDYGWCNTALRWLQNNEKLDCCPSTVDGSSAHWYRSLLCPRPCASDVWRLSDVCLSRIGPKSRTQRGLGRIGTEVEHVARDSGTTFKVKRSNVKLQGAGAYCGVLPHSLLKEARRTRRFGFARSCIGRSRFHSDYARLVNIFFPKAKSVHYV